MLLVTGPDLLLVIERVSSSLLLFYRLFFVLFRGDTAGCFFFREARELMLVFFFLAISGM